MLNALEVPVLATHLKKRLIPKLLIQYRQIGALSRPVLVTTRQYREIHDVGDAVSQAKIYEAQLADELIVLNINSTPIADDKLMLSVIERLANETFMPITVGGGVRTLSDFSYLLNHGADKVCINAAALANPVLIRDAALQFGSQCVVVSIDFHHDDHGNPVVFSKSNRHIAPMHVVEWAKRAVEAGAGELLLTDVNRDGTGSGLNCEIGRAVVEQVSVPVILSGGCGLSTHFIEGFQQAGVAGIAAGTFFCFRDQNPIQTRAHIRNAGVPIRMEL